MLQKINTNEKAKVKRDGFLYFTIQLIRRLVVVNMSTINQTQTTEKQKDHVKDFHTDAAVWGLEFSFRLGDPLLPGEKIPFFQGEAIKHGQKIEVSPESYIGRPLLIFFHPGDFTSAGENTLNLVASMLTNKEAIDLNLDYMVVSTDSLSVHDAWVRLRDHGMPDVALVSDKTGEIAKAFGVLDVKTHKSFNAMFLVDQNGIAQYTTISGMDITGDVIEKLRDAMN